MIWSNVAFSWYYPSHDFCAEDTQISFLHDPDGSLSQDAVLERLRGAPKVLSPQTFSFGYTKGKVWLYLKVAKAEGLQKCVLELANPQLDEIEIYQFIGGKSFKVASMGDQFSFTERFYRVRNYVFPFQADQNQEFIISLQSSATMTVPVSIKWRDQYVNDSSLDYLLLGLFYGLMLCFIFVGIHNLVSFREKSFGIYALFAIFLMLWRIARLSAEEKIPSLRKADLV
ncbi:MAG: 7TM-DISM domain-containing protein [Oligoflexales bacterium]